MHCPLTPENKYIISDAAIARMKNGVMLINTSRGALLDTVAIVEGLKSGKIGYLGLDVYEEEEEIFFEDRSGLILSDDVFARLLTFPNVIITGHQAFFTREALLNIAVRPSTTSRSSRTISRWRSWQADSDAGRSSSVDVLGKFLDFALQKLRGSLRRIPATEAVFSKGFCKCIRDLSPA